MPVSNVLWAIDQETSPRDFERLCVDLLYRAGYRDIVPIEPQDGGRDAEQQPRPGRGQAGEAAFFQFSAEADWKAKLRRDARKLKDGGFEFSTLVFVTTRSARGVDRDALSREVKQNHGWVLSVFGREWLRLQLEEAHPDLAQKYLGIEAPHYSPRLLARMHFGKSSDDRLADAWLAFRSEQFERAAVEFREFLSEYGATDHEVLQALAWCQYCVYRYDEALANINRALRIQEGRQARSIRGCILVEKGIRDSDRASLLEGRRMFQFVRDHTEGSNWLALYNLGNVESALGNHAEAIELYRAALETDREQPEVWKNLASAYHLIGNHETEMECLDQVLSIEPDKVEALVSKGTSLMLDLNRPQEAIPLLERALTLQQDWSVHWPHIWYWTAEAHRQAGNHQRALTLADDGLAQQPGSVALKRLKSDVLIELIGADSAVAPIARQFWSAALADQPRDFTIRERLIRTEQAYGDPTAAWRLIEDCFELMELDTPCPLRESGFEEEEVLLAAKHLPQYLLFREQMPLSNYWNRADSLYDLPFEPPEADKLEPVLSAFLAVPFGMAFDAFERSVGSGDSAAALGHLKGVLGPLVERAFVNAARYLATDAPDQEHDVDVFADKITKMIMFLGLAAMREFSRQFGWIPSQFRVPTDVVHDAIDGLVVHELQGAVSSASFVAIAERSTLFSGAKPTAE